MIFFDSRIGFCVLSPVMRVMVFPIPGSESGDWERNVGGTRGVGLKRGGSAG